MYGPWTTAAGLFAVLIFILVFTGMTWVGLWGKKMVDKIENEKED